MVLIVLSNQTQRSNVNGKLSTAHTVNAPLIGHTSRQYTWPVAFNFLMYIKGGYVTGISTFLS